MNTTEIAKRIQEHIKQGHNKFIIYPFGYNGILIKNILKEYFNLEPYMIVDNFICGINSSVISGEKLQKKYKDDMTVILTVENRETNIQILSQLAQFVDLEDVVNILGPIHRYLPQFILPPPPRGGVKSKIKVRIPITDRTDWHIHCNICSAMSTDNDIDLLLINQVVFKQNDFKEVMSKYNCIDVEHYKPDEDLPDILLTTIHFDNYLPKIRMYVKKVIVLQTWNLYDYKKINFVNKFYNISARLNPDYWLIDKFQCGNLNIKSNIIEIESPKLDSMYKSVKESILPPLWNKIKGKKIILWINTHGISTNHHFTNDNPSFGTYAKTILNYMLQNPDMALIIRFHPLLERELIYNNIWTKDTIKLIEEYFYNTENVVLDKNITYNDALAISHAVVVEANGLSAGTVLPSLKPVCIAYKSTNQLNVEPRLDQLCYHAHNKDEIIEFFDMIKLYEDPLYEKRKEFIGKYIKHFDGKNGERIKNLLKKIYEEDIKILDRKEKINE